MNTSRKTLVAGLLAGDVQGAYTVVDGHHITLGANDYVLTPNGAWHDHGVVAEGEVSIWQDGLDIPLMNSLETNFYAVYDAPAQTRAFPSDDLPLSYGGSMAPDGVEAWSSSQLLPWWRLTMGLSTLFKDFRQKPGHLDLATGDAIGHEVVAITDSAVSLREPGAPTRTLQLPELGTAPPVAPRR